MAVPIGRDPPGSRIVLTTLKDDVSTTATVPSVSAGTNARDPSGRKATVRGRPPALNSPTGLPVFVSTTTTSPPVSQVTYTCRPSGDRATPSGSSFTGTIRSTLPAATSRTLIVPTSSFET